MARAQVTFVCITHLKVTIGWPASDSRQFISNNAPKKMTSHWRTVLNMALRNGAVPMSHQSIPRHIPATRRKIRVPMRLPDELVSMTAKARFIYGRVVQGALEGNGVKPDLPKQPAGQIGQPLALGIAEPAGAVERGAA